MEFDPTTWAQTTWLEPQVIFVRLLLALVCGAVVGFEREWRQRPAGLRTHILVCLTACLLAVLTIEIAHLQDFDSEAARIDPIRLIEAVTAGVAFLAAGLIIFSRGEVIGLTTGAGMWLAAAIGLASGLGYPQIALLATIFAIIVLWLIRHLEKPKEKVHRQQERDFDEGRKN